MLSEKSPLNLQYLQQPVTHRVSEREEEQPEFPADVRRVHREVVLEPRDGHVLLHALLHRLAALAEHVLSVLHGHVLHGRVLQHLRPGEAAAVRTGRRGGSAMVGHLLLWLVIAAVAAVPWLRRRVAWTGQQGTGLDLATQLVIPAVAAVPGLRRRVAWAGQQGKGLEPVTAGHSCCTHQRVAWIWGQVGSLTRARRSTWNEKSTVLHLTASSNMGSGSIKMEINWKHITRKHTPGCSVFHQSTLNYFQQLYGLLI